MSLTIDKEITDNDLLSSLAAELNSMKAQPGDVTVTDLCRVTGMKNDACRTFLKAKVDAGVLVEVAGVYVNGHPTTVYRKSVQKQKNPAC